MSSDKEMILKLLGACEKLFFERYVLQSLLMGAKVPGWQEMYDKLVADPLCRSTTRLIFEPAFEAIRTEMNWEQALEGFLRDLPDKKPN